MAFCGVGPHILLVLAGFAACLEQEITFECEHSTDLWTSRRAVWGLIIYPAKGGSHRARMAPSQPLVAELAEGDVLCVFCKPTGSGRQRVGSCATRPPSTGGKVSLGLVVDLDHDGYPLAVGPSFEHNTGDLGKTRMEVRVAKVLMPPVIRTREQRGPGSWESSSSTTTPSILSIVTKYWYIVMPMFVVFVVSSFLKAQQDAREEASS